MTPLRFKVLAHYLKSKTTTPFSEVVQYFFAPSYKSIASQYIERIEPGEPEKKVYFKGIPDPLYFPSDVDDHSLHLVTVETFNKKNWHYYEISQTTVGPDDVVIDCGAAEGLFALKVQNRCKKIYLIEPLQKFIHALHKTFANKNNIEILQLGVSDKEFTTRISSNDISSALSDSAEGNEVKVTTLDALFADKNIPITYLKADVEGHDLKALLGAEKIIKKYKPKIAVTTYHIKEHADQISKYLKSIVPEYKIFTKGIYQETGSPVMLHAWI